MIKFILGTIIGFMLGVFAYAVTTAPEVKEDK